MKASDNYTHVHFIQDNLMGLKRCIVITCGAMKPAWILENFEIRARTFYFFLHYVEAIDWGTDHTEDSASLFTPVQCHHHCQCQHLQLKWKGLVRNHEFVRV